MKKVAVIAKIEKERYAIKEDPKLFEDFFNREILFRFAEELKQQMPEAIETTLTEQTIEKKLEVVVITKEEFKDLIRNLNHIKEFYPDNLTINKLCNMVNSVLPIGIF